MSRLLVGSARQVLRVNAQFPSRVCAYHAPSDHREVTMNDLPVPQGSWQTDYDSKQRKYNLHLALGIGFTVATLVIARASGLFELNYAVPKLREQ